jgi:oligopeptide/dipeptide ABC transporter ATP-binding protein
MNPRKDPSAPPPQPLLRIENLGVEFSSERGPIRAVDHVSLQLDAGETLGLVGESGCGKSVTALSILNLIPSPPGRITHGSIHLNGIEVTRCDTQTLRSIRGPLASMIFQEPMTALNPVYSIGNQMMEVIRTHRRMPRAQARQHALELLESVQVESPSKRLDQYPHELSGGMRQRVMIAMALSCDPRLLIADEPTTALDVTVQAQVMRVIREQQQSRNMGLLLITHDLGIIAESCQNVAVMYCGQIIEIAPTTALFQHPAHPYTQGLLEAIPRIQGRRLERLPVIPGRVPDLSKLPEGCRFADRCPRVQARCREAMPTLSDLGKGRKAACFFPNPGAVA